MDIEREEKKNKDKENTEIENKTSVDLAAKVTISKVAESLMSDLVTRVNDGFEYGRVSRHQLMSWILVKFSEDCSDQDIKAIRADHFDEIALLELSLKKFRQAGTLPPELKKMLLSQAGLDDMAKRSSKKAS